MTKPIPQFTVGEEPPRRVPHGPVYAGMWAIYRDGQRVECDVFETADDRGASYARAIKRAAFLAELWQREHGRKRRPPPPSTMVKPTGRPSS